MTRNNIIQNLAAFSLLAVALGAAGCSADDEMADESVTLVDIAAGDENFSTLVAALDKAGLVEALQGEGPFTVFAPTNAAFAAAGITDLDALSADELASILLYHVVPGSVSSSEIPAKADTLSTNEWGNGLTVLFDTTDGVSVNGASVTTADLMADNGVIHVIDDVLLPPSIVDMAQIGGFDSLVGAVLAADDLEGGPSVAEALVADAPYTVFAPINQAFTDLGAVDDTELLRDVLLLHVVNAGAPVLSNGIPAAADSLLPGESLTFDSSAPSVSSDGTTDAAIAITDINVTNGVIHAIDAVLLP
jgi:transforming growth factor-beta-induced protein